MVDLTMVMTVALLFLLRIGVPVVVLVTLGLFIDHWQTSRVRRF